MGLGDLAVVDNWDGARSLAQIVEIQRDQVSLQVFTGGKGLSTDARVHFLGRSTQVKFSPNILGRVFDGVGQPVDGGPWLGDDRRVDAGGPSVNPTLRIVPKKFIETKVPMIDVFDCRVECQKIPIFSIAGEPYNKLLAQIGIQANADIIVFCGMGLIFDDFHFFRSTFENEGVFARSVMFVNQASDPIVERLLAPDLALKVAERFTVEENKRVLVFAQADGRGQAEASVGACRKAFSCQDYHTSSLHRAETPRRDVRTRQKTTFRFFVFPCRLTSAKNSNHQTPDFQQAASRKGRWVGCSGFLHLAAIRTIRRASRRKTENQIGFETGRILRSQQFEPAMIAFHYNTVPGNGNYP